MNVIVVIGAAVLGVIVGPLLRRAIDQVPGRRALFADPDAPIRPSSLLPVTSWFEPEPYGSTSYFLGADDRAAAEEDDDENDEDDELADEGDEEGDEDEVAYTNRKRAPLIDATVAAAMAAMAYRFGWSWELPAVLVFAAALVVVSVIDIDHYRIPNRVVYPTLFTCSALLVLAALVADVPGGLIAAAGGAAAYYSFLFIFFFIYPKGMGFGDVKLALVLGLHAGWAGSVANVDDVLVYAGWVHGMRLVLMAALAGSILGSIIGLGTLMSRQKRGAFPFGPALCLGAALAIVFSEQIL